MNSQNVLITRSLWEPALQNLKPQSEITGTKTVVINLLWLLRRSSSGSVHVPIKLCLVSHLTFPSAQDARKQLLPIKNITTLLS